MATGEGGLGAAAPDGRRTIRAMATDHGHGGGNGEEGINVRCI